MIETLAWSSQAIETFSTFGVGMALPRPWNHRVALFFSALSRLGVARPREVRIRGWKKKDTWATVHTQDGETFERVRFMGHEHRGRGTTHLPYDLNGGWPSGGRGVSCVPHTKAINMIVIAPAGEPPGDEVQGRDAMDRGQVGLQRLNP